MDREKETGEARYALHRLQKEMRNVDRIADIRIDVGDFLSFADYFFDGVVADWLVQSKISDARRQVDDAIWKSELKKGSGNDKIRRNFARKLAF